MIVEPNFRDCFCIAHPTPRFEALLDALPSAVVASRVGVQAVVPVPQPALACRAAGRGARACPRMLRAVIAAARCACQLHFICCCAMLRCLYSACGPPR